MMTQFSHMQSWLYCELWQGAKAALLGCCMPMRGDV